VSDKSETENPLPPLQIMVLEPLEPHETYLIWARGEEGTELCIGEGPNEDHARLDAVDKLLGLAARIRRGVKSTPPG